MSPPRDVLLLPGWGFDDRIWQPLRAHLPAWRFHHLDPLATPAALPGRFVMIGWSLGALVALDLARHLYGRCSHLVLFAATPRFTLAEHWPHGLEPALLDDFGRRLSDDAAALCRHFTTLIAHGDTKHKTLLRILTTLLDQSLAQEDALTGLHLLRTMDLRPVLTTITQPTLLLHGARDVLMPAAAGRYLADRLPRAHFHLLPDAGHAPLLSQPEVCAALMLDWLEQHDD